MAIHTKNLLIISDRDHKVKILLTAHQFLPEYSAGTEILTYNTAKILKNLGHEVSIFCGYPSPDDMADRDRFKRYEYDGMPVTQFIHKPTPMGRQKNIFELEYNNLFFADYLRNHLQKESPDIVHFFHLQRLSASAIDVCHELDIPMVFTPTDFWFVCLTNQLRLTDNSMCSGPTPDMLNCFRHKMELKKNNKVKQILFNQMPDWLMSTIIRKVQKTSFPKLPAVNYIRALSCRFDFLMKRMNMLDRVIVPTRLMEGILRENGLKPEKMILNPFGIDSETVRLETPGPEQKFTPSRFYRHSL